MRYLFFALIGLSALGGCASLPDAEIKYRHTTTVVDISVNRAISCTPQNHPKIVHSVEIKPTYSADFLTNPSVINLSHFDGLLSNATAEFEFFEDGRLKSISSESEGKVQQALETGIGVLDTLSLFSPSERREACDFINDGDSKRSEAKTVTYKGKLRLYDADDLVQIRNSQQIELEIAAESKATADSIVVFLEPITIQFTDGKVIEGAVSSRLSARDPRSITLRKTMDYVVTVFSGQADIWTNNIILAGNLSENLEYAVPIPKAAAFGNASFELALAESGAITKIGFGSSGGTEATSSVISKFASALESETDKERADNIYQAERLAICLANRSECPSK